MANAVTSLSYANTFGDWVVTTNALVKEHNDLVANNYFKNTGTLYLNDPTTGLSVSNNAIIGGQLQIVGPQSSLRMDNNLRVDGQVYFTNTTLGLTSSGPTLLNNNLTVTGNETVGGNVDVTGNVSAAHINENGIRLKTYIDNANTWLQANDVLTLSTAKDYTDTAVSNILLDAEAYTNNANT